MSSTVDRADLINALRLRYDAHSAETIFAAALANAGLADQASYTAADIAAWRGALRKVGDRLANVDIRLDALVENLGGASAAAAPAAAAPPTAAPPAAVPAAAAPASAAVAPASPAAASTPAPATAPAAVAPAASKPATTEAAPAATATTLKLVGVELADNENLLVCGSFVDWKIERAIAMKRTGDAWHATLPVAPDPTIVFKFVRSGPDGKLTWEGGKDRKLAASTIEATWQPEEPTS